MGFALDNKLLIIAGALECGSSGFILSVIMCKAMNRSFTNVLFGAFGQVQAATAAKSQQQAGRSRHAPRKPPRSWHARANVIIVPGYGMAVAQAQHKVRELTDLLTKRGVDVQFAIHPSPAACPAT